MMRPLRVLGALGSAMRLESILLLLPIPVALHWGAQPVVVLGLVHLPKAAVVFLGTSMLCAVFWIPVMMATRRARQEDMLEREGVLTVALGWILASLFGMIPFLAMGTFRGAAAPMDAFFEAMSGFTGTGMSAVPADQLASLDRSLVLWRSVMPFVGGIGIIVLFVALLSKLQQGSLPLVPAETSGHVMRRLKPKLEETARTLLMLYVGVAGVLVAVMMAILLARHYPVDDALYQALCHVLSAFSTGGFATNATATLVHDPVFASALALCMLLGATNFTLLFLLVRRRDARMLGDPEWRFWLTALSLVALANAAILWVNHKGSLGYALRESAYTVIAFGTGTGGLAHADYATGDWPAASLLLLILLMIMGGMSGSAAGGVKGSRWLVLVKMLGRELRRILHPRAIIPVRIGDRILKEETITAVAAFFFTYLAAWTLGTIAITATDPGHFPSLEAGAFASAAALGNAGGGIFPAAAGYAVVLPTTKLILSVLMWGGRLELFAALLVFNPKSWKS